METQVLSALVVTEPEAGQKIYQFLIRRFAAPPTVVHKWIRKGEVRLNGKRIKAFARVTRGDSVRVPPQAYYIQQEQQENTAQTTEQSSLPLPPVVAEWNAVLFFNKPAGLAVHPGSGRTDSLTQRLAVHYQHAPFLPTPAHRIDAETSGLLAVGTTYESVRQLSDIFAQQSTVHVAKYYFAWVYGEWKFGHCFLEDVFLRKKQQTYTKSKQSFEQMQCVSSKTQAVNSMNSVDLLDSVATVDTADIGVGIQKQSESTVADEIISTMPAQSIVQCITTQAITGQPFSLLCIQLLTGRTHQIRVQLAQRKHSIVGDRKYGSLRNMDSKGQRDSCQLLLHAAGLQFFDTKKQKTKAVLFQCQCIPKWHKPFTVKAVDIFAKS